MTGYQKTHETYEQAFSCVCDWLQIFASNSDWSTGLTASVLINYSTVKLPYTYIKGTPARVLVTELSGVNMWTFHEAWFLLYLNLYYFMRNFCNLIGLEQWYFSLIWNTYV